MSAQQNKVIGDGVGLETYFPGFNYLSAWNTPEAFSRYIEGKTAKDAWDRDPSAWESEDASFYGTRTLKQATDLGRYGWKEGAEQADRVRDKILSANPMLFKPVKFGIVGSVPDVARAVSGNPLNMRALDTSKSRRRPVITLISSMSANCGVDKDAISNRAALVAAIVDQIEVAGYSCEVITVAPTQGFNRGTGMYRANTAIIVKHSNQPADIARLAFSLGHAAMFRRLVFADWQTEPSCKDGIGSCLGSSIQLKPTREWAEKSVYYIPSAGQREDLYKDEETTATKGLDYLLTNLKEQGCPAFAEYETKYAEKTSDESKRKKDFELFEEDYE